MGTYIEEIYFPLGSDEAKRRISKWQQKEGKDFKLVRKGENWFHIKHKSLHFIVTFLRDHVQVESWVGDFPKYTIAPDVIVGAFARRNGWKIYQTLRETITEGIESGELR